MFRSNRFAFCSDADSISVKYGKERKQIIERYKTHFFKESVMVSWVVRMFRSNRFAFCSDADSISVILYIFCLWQHDAG